MANKNNNKMSKAKNMCFNDIQWTQVVAGCASEVAHCSTAIVRYFQGFFILGILDVVFIHHIWPCIFNLKQDHEV